jgi:hypothetical protein
MVMVVKRGMLPDPTWENLVMQRFPKEVQWSVTQMPDGFVAEVRGFVAPQIFQEWQDGLTWVAVQFGISPEALHDVKANTRGKHT